MDNRKRKSDAVRIRDPFRIVPRVLASTASFAKPCMYPGGGHLSATNGGQRSSFPPSLAWRV